MINDLNLFFRSFHDPRAYEEYYRDYISRYGVPPFPVPSETTSFYPPPRGQPQAHTSQSPLPPGGPQSPLRVKKPIEKPVRAEREKKPIEEKKSEKDKVKKESSREKTKRESSKDVREVQGTRKDNPERRGKDKSHTDKGRAKERDRDKSEKAPADSTTFSQGDQEKGRNNPKSETSREKRNVTDARSKLQGPGRKGSSTESRVEKSINKVRRNEEKKRDSDRDSDSTCKKSKIKVSQMDSMVPQKTEKENKKPSKSRKEKPTSQSECDSSQKDNTPMETQGETIPVIVSKVGAGGNRRRLKREKEESGEESETSKSSKKQRTDSSSQELSLSQSASQTSFRPSSQDIPNESVKGVKSLPNLPVSDKVIEPVLSPEGRKKSPEKVSPLVLSKVLKKGVKPESLSSVVAVQQSASESSLKMLPRALQKSKREPELMLNVPEPSKWERDDYGQAESDEASGRVKSEKKTLPR